MAAIRERISHSVRNIVDVTLVLLDQASVALTGFHIEENAAIKTGQGLYQSLAEERLPLQNVVHRLRELQNKPHFGLILEGLNYLDEKDGFKHGGEFRGKDDRGWNCDIKPWDEGWIVSYPDPLQDFAKYHRFNKENPGQMPIGFYTGRIQQALEASIDS